MSRVRHLVAMITALIASLNPTLACWCGREVEEKYCHSDFVIKAKILSGSSIYEDKWSRVYEYHIELLKNYKPSPRFDSARHVIQAYDAESQCGVQLSAGSTYILLGSFSADKRWYPSEQLVLRTGLCDRNYPLSSNPAVAENEAENVMAFLDDGNFRCEK